MQVLYTLYTDSASKNLNCFFVLFFFFLSFDVRVAILFIFYSNIRPAQLNSSYKRNQTLHLFACVRARAWVCVCVRMVYVHAHNVRRGLLLSVLQLIVKLVYIVFIALRH